MLTVNDNNTTKENDNVDLDILKLNTSNRSRFRSYSMTNLNDTDDATRFNANIRDNYAKLINYNKSNLENATINTENDNLNVLHVNNRFNENISAKNEFLNLKNSELDDKKEEENKNTNKTIINAKNNDYNIENDIDNDDEILPSSTTMQFKEEHQRHVDVKNRVGFKFSAKAKLMCCIYAVVIITLFTLIILNTKALASLNKDINTMQAQVYTMKETNVDLNNDLKAVSSEENIKKWASDILGMVEKK